MSKRKKRSYETDAVPQSQSGEIKKGWFDLENPKLVTIILVCVFGLGIFLRVNYLNISDYRSGADEGFYQHYASYIAQNGVGSIRTLVGEFIANEKWHLYPPPLRAGHILLGAAFMKITNRFDFAPLSYMSSFFSILSLFVGYLFTKKLFGKKIALFSLILFTVSPLNLALARRALQESIIYFFIITTVYLFYETIEKRNLFHFIALFLTFFVAVMIKETSVLMAVFFLSYLMIEKLYFKKGSRIFWSLLPIVAASIAVFFTCIAVAGGIKNMLDIVKIVLLSPKSNAYALKFQSGPFYRYLYDYFLVSPATLILCISSLWVCYRQRKFLESSYRYLGSFFLVMFIVFSLFIKNIRYVMMLDFPIRIFAAMLIWHVSAKAKDKGSIMALSITGIIAASDFCIFIYLFIYYRIYDPVTYQLIEVWKRAL